MSSDVNREDGHRHTVAEVMIDLSRPQKPREFLRLFFTGMTMGAADVVPGVSGGTMAFIMGIYETLINAIKSFNLDAIRLLLGRKFGEFFLYIPFRFLIALGLGIMTSVFTLSGLLDNLLSTQPTFVFAFFAGLILASVLAIGLKVQWNPRAFLAAAIGTVIAFVIVGLPTLGEQLGHNPLILIFSGAIAICAMILPGISGSFILLILGQYQFVLSAVKSLDIISIVSVGIGSAVGIVTFSRVLSWLLKYYENATVALLVGFMLGSLRLIIHRMTHITEAETEVETVLTLAPETILASVGIGIIGFLIVSFLDHMQTKDNPIFRVFMKRSA